MYLRIDFVVLVDYGQGNIRHAFYEETVPDILPYTLMYIDTLTYIDIALDVVLLLRHYIDIDL